MLPKDDPELTKIVRERLLAEGILLHERVAVEAVEPGPTLVVRSGERPERVAGTHLLVATGRRPNVEGLDLERARVAYDAKGIKVDRGLRTSNRRIYAIGDVAGGLQFTHLANHHAGLVIKNALFRLPVRASEATIPRVTFTDPELAAVGLSAAEAKAGGVAHEIARWSFAENDRARAERRTEGLLKAVIGKRGKILGAAIVGAHAGELILPWVLALERGLKISALASLVAPYPTLSR